MTPLELASAPRPSLVSRRLELTLGQRRLWALERRRPGDPAYHQLSAVRLEGRLHRAALQAALAQVIERHASLRARFPTEGDTPVCIIDTQSGVSLRHYDLSPLQPESRARAVAALARREARRPFDLADGPLLRASLLVLDDDEAVLVLCFHHMIIDGWSLGTLLGELCRTYAALSEGQAPPTVDPGPAYSLDDYVAESLAASRSPQGARALAYWSKHLAGISWSCIPYEHERHGDAQVRTGRTLRRYWNGLRDTIDAAARQQQVTRYQLLLCAFLQHVAECTGNPDVAIATLLANRPSRERQALVGFLANTVILRHRFATGEDARSRLQRVVTTLRDMLRHGDVSLHSIAEEIPGVLDKPPSILFSLQNNPLPTFRAGNLRLSMLDIDSGAAKFDLSIYVAERGAGLDLWVEYDTSLYSEACVDEFVERFRLTLETLCSDLGQGVSRVTEALHHMSPSASGMISPTPRGKGLLEALYDTMASAPSRTALEVDDHPYTFAEIRRDVAAALAGLRDIGARPGDRVAVLGARTRATLATIWACLIAHLTYVPISPDLPRARMLQILDDADPAWRVADHEVNPPGEWHDARQWLAKSGDNEAPLPALPTDRNAWPAYILYTSGSTGVPKGVVVSQGNLAVFCAAMDATIPRGDHEVWLAVSPLSFDISVLELFWAMSRGMCVRVAAMADLVASDDRIERVGGIPDLGIAFFGSTDQYAAEEHLDLVESIAIWADDNGLRTLWTPERHFGAFGGFFSNPALMSSHLLARTRRVRVHAGSVIAPLHRTARLAEDWAALSRISGGRAGLSLAPGWNPPDFVLADVPHAERHDAVARQADELRALWRGETVAFPDPDGRFFDVRLPLACPDGLPLAMTVSHRGEQFEAAATRGLDVLTHLLEQGLPELAANIERYRQAWERQHGAGSTPGRVTVMIHTYVGSDTDDALARALPPLARYLASAGAALRSLHAPVAPTAALDGELLEAAARRMIRERSLIGDAASVATTLCSLYGIGVDEVASLVDFGLSRDEVLAGLDRLAALRTPSASTDTAQFPATHFQCTPSAARLLVQRKGGLPAALDKLACWAIGGEAMDADLIRRLRLRSSAQVFNMYGPTETTVWASSATLKPRRSGPITIGSGLPGYGLYVLDDELFPVPTEVEGQLYIAGDGVAQGYWRRPSATAAAFVPSPFGPPGARLYASGDRVRRRHDGTLVFVGRRDSQVKINGHRVDLAGLRALLVLHEDVIDAHLHCVAADAATTHASQSIVAFVILREAHAANALQSLHDHLARYCEVAVLPREFIALEAFPMTASQKLDARRLDELYREHLASRENIPDASEEDPEAAELRELWQSMLPAFTERADFHRAGGNSLIAMQLLARANAHFGAQTTLVEFYRAPTLQGHLATIRGSRGTHRAVPLVPGERKGVYPVSFAQRAMLIVDELAGDRIAYHDDVTLRLRGDLQVDILADTYAGMLRRHRLFSTAYRFDGNDYLQWWRDEPAAGLRAAALTEGASLDEVLDRFRHERFDLGAGNVVRALLLTLSPHEHVLCLVLHHIVSDGTTLRLLLDEWLERYRLGSQGKMPDATEAAWQYVDFVEWQKRRVEAREAELHAFWDGRLKECLDAPSTIVTEGHAAELTVGLDETEADVIDGMVRDHRVGEFSALTFPMVMALESGSAGTVILATDVRNRERPEFEAVPGMMVNQLLLPLHLPKMADAAAATATLHDQVVACLSHQELPYERLVSRWRRLTGRQDEPPFDVKFVLNEPARPSHLDGIEVSECRLPTRHAKFGVLINLRRDGKRYTGTLVYDSARHSADWVRSLWADYRWLLSRLGGMTDLAEERVALAAHRAGQQAGKGSPGLARLRTARRRVGRVESALVKVVEEPHVPVVQAWPGVPGQTLAAAVTRSREVLVSQVLSRGAVLLRGFAGVDAEALMAAVDTLCGPALAYTERSTPRTELGKRLYSATEYPAHQRIDLHNENSYAARWPGTLFFWCACPAETGGENLLADSRRLLERIPRGIVQTFERAGVLYRRELGPPLGMPWRYVFQCNTPDELDAAAQLAGYAVRWHSPERLTLSRHGQAIIAHPVTGERSWFNHALFFHESSLPEEIRAGLGTLYGNDYLPHRSFLGDGSPIPPRVIAELRHAYAECERELLLRKDDILILDNLLIAHGRRPFTGRRDIRLMMGNILGVTR